MQKSTKVLQSDGRGLLKALGCPKRKQRIGGGRELFEEVHRGFQNTENNSSEIHEVITNASQRNPRNHHPPVITNTPKLKSEREFNRITLHKDILTSKKVMS